ncbi:unnamed protein product, partial [Chrysoparadoxa australica]
MVRFSVVDESSRGKTKVLGEVELAIASLLASDEALSLAIADTGKNAGISKGIEVWLPLYCLRERVGEVRLNLRFLAQDFL